jgi:predicted component of type VI protein secretion system
LFAPGQPDAVAGYVSMDGRIVSRADAYRRLTEAADYLLHTEPHSPVPYLVKRAIQWGNMSLAELLQEFIGNADDLVTVHRLLGMRPRDE